MIMVLDPRILPPTFSGFLEAGPGPPSSSFGAKLALRQCIAPIAERALVNFWMLPCAPGSPICVVVDRVLESLSDQPLRCLPLETGLMRSPRSPEADFGYLHFP